MDINSKEFCEIKEITKSIVDCVFCNDKISDKTITSRELIIFKTLDRLVRRVFFLVVNMNDKDFERYLETQRKQMRAKGKKQNINDYELTELFFDLLECKRREFKILQKLERVEK